MQDRPVVSDETKNEPRDIEDPDPMTPLRRYPTAPRRPQWPQGTRRPRGMSHDIHYGGRRYLPAIPEQASPAPGQPAANSDIGAAEEDRPPPYVRESASHQVHTNGNVTRTTPCDEDECCYCACCPAMCLDCLKCCWPM